MSGRRTFVVRIWEGGPIVAEDLASRDRIVLDDLTALPAVIASWLAPAPARGTEGENASAEP